MTMDNQERFKKNCDRWSLFCPRAACFLPALDSIGIAETKQPLIENVEAWAEKLNFSDFQLLYVYGLNTVLPYTALKEWCRENENTLVILEDDLEVIYHFLNSEEAEELLNNKNVWLFFLDPMRRALGEITKLFPNIPYQVTTIYTDETKLKTLEELKSQIAFFYNLHTSQIGEFSHHGVAFFNNYFRNLFSLPKSYLANHLFGQFKDVPAIICGAGPSLGKNIETLKELKDRALIFAGGSSMNALNGMGMTAHLGVGIDPNEEYISRIISNMAFEVPFLYRGRIHHQALEFVQSDKVYVTGSVGYNIATYFEKEFGLEGEEIEEGCNVINFSLALALAMGCNPIILVGVDLAYSDDKTYAPGMISHPIHGQFRSKIYNEELIFRKDIHGNTVPTLWKWVTESLWFSNFAEMHPEAKIINSTEGGLGFAGIPNIPLADVAQEMLTKNQTISCKLFGKLQRGKISPDLTEDKICAALKNLTLHHEEMQKILQNHYNELVDLQKNLDGQLEPRERTPVSTQYNEMKDSLTKKLMDKIRDKESYKYLLENFNRAYDLFYLKRYVRLEIDLLLYPQREWNHLLLQLEMDRTHYLLQTVSVNHSLIHQILNEKKQQPLPREQVTSTVQDLDPLTGGPLTRNCTYQFENNRLLLSDPECNLAISEEFIPEDLSGCIKNYDDAGKLQFESYQKNGKPHGPSRYYSKEGNLLAEYWYLNGLQEGKAFRYYPSGVLHSIQNYMHGIQHGRQEYYHENHMPRLLIEHYEQGLLHGDVMIFHPNGTMIRKLHFNNGRHDGPDTLWYPDGKKRIEAFFKDNSPTGTAQAWHANGRLAHQIVYSDNSEITSVSYWDESGRAISGGISSKDYFQQVASSSQQLTTNLTVLFQELTALTPFLMEMQGANPDRERGTNKELAAMAENLNIVGTAIRDLTKLNEQLIQEASIDAQNRTEAFWKTSALQKEVQEKLNLATAQMQNELSQLRSTINHTVESLLKRSIANPNDSEKTKSD